MDKACTMSANLLADNLTTGGHRSDQSHPAFHRRMAVVTAAAVWLLVQSRCLPAQSTIKPADIWICEYDVDAAKSRRLFIVSDLLDVGDVQYGPGDQIAFDGRVPGRHGTSSSHVFVSDRAGAQRRDLGPGLKSSWSPRGRRLCLSRNSPEYGVWLLAADGRETRLIDNRGWGASWSHGGQKIAYVRSLEGRANLVVWNLVEDDLSAVLPQGGLPEQARIAAVPRWSPDDRQLACRVSSEQTHELQVVLLASGRTSTVYRGAGLLPGFSWQDASRILVAIDDDVPGRSQIYRVDVTAPEQPATVVPGLFTERANSLPAVSSDGRRFLYVSRPRG